jgi:hypothetical protein
MLEPNSPEEDSLIVVDTRPLVGSVEGAVDLAYPVFGTVSDLLDSQPHAPSYLTTTEALQSVRSLVV